MNHSKIARRPTLVLALGTSIAFGVAFAAGAAQLANPLVRPTLVTPRAFGSVLLGVTLAGKRLVAVGERGVVLVSDDAGASWRQVPVPVSTTLTAVRFVDARLGWAVGHAGVVLRTTDGGQSWARQLDGKTAAELILKAADPADAAAQKAAQRLVADGADKPFLDLHFFDAKHGVVVGAYGLALGTSDGGASWVPWLSRIDNPKGLHLNAVAARGDTVMLAGEQGLLLRSTDGGRQFTPLHSPYEGSWFAVAPLAAGRWVMAGLRGNVYTFDEESTTFAQAEMPVPVSVSALTVLADGRVIALNQAGQVLASRDQGKTFQPLPVTPGPPLTGLQALPDGAFVASSLRGTRNLPALP